MRLHLTGVQPRRPPQHALSTVATAFPQTTNTPWCCMRAGTPSLITPSHGAGCDGAIMCSSSRPATGLHQVPGRYLQPGTPGGPAFWTESGPSHFLPSTGYPHVGGSSGWRPGRPASLRSRRRARRRSPRTAGQLASGPDPPRIRVQQHEHVAGSSTCSHVPWTVAGNP